MASISQSPPIDIPLRPSSKAKNESNLESTESEDSGEESSVEYTPSSPEPGPSIVPDTTKCEKQSYDKIKEDPEGALREQMALFAYHRERYEERNLKDYENIAQVLTEVAGRLKALELEALEEQAARGQSKLSSALETPSPWIEMASSLADQRNYRQAEKDYTPKVESDNVPTSDIKDEMSFKKSPNITGTVRPRRRSLLTEALVAERAHSPTLIEQAGQDKPSTVGSTGFETGQNATSQPLFGKSATREISSRLPDLDYSTVPAVEEPVSAYKATTCRTSYASGLFGPSPFPSTTTKVVRCLCDPAPWLERAKVSTGQGDGNAVEKSVLGNNLQAFERVYRELELLKIRVQTITSDLLIGVSQALHHFKLTSKVAESLDNTMGSVMQAIAETRALINLLALKEAQKGLVEHKDSVVQYIKVNALGDFFQPSHAGQIHLPLGVTWPKIFELCAFLESKGLNLKDAAVIMGNDHFWWDDLKE